MKSIALVIAFVLTALLLPPAAEATGPRFARNFRASQNARNAEFRAREAEARAREARAVQRELDALRGFNSHGFSSRGLQRSRPPSFFIDSRGRVHFIR